MAVSPGAVIGCLFAGWANSAFWTLSPLYGTAAGLDVAGIAQFLSLGVLGGAASQWPVGLLSDRLGRRGLIVAVATVGVGAGLALWLAGAAGRVNPLLLAALFGAATFPIYPLSVAHANDLVPARRSVAVSGGLLLMFSVGAIAGPIVATGIITVAGPAALFLHTAIAHAVIVAGLLARVKLRPDPPVRRTTGYVLLPRTTPAVFELDPRAPELAPASATAVEVTPATGGLPGTGGRL
jgi:MFS family permease